MKKRRTALEIKKKIIDLLKQKEMSIREIETKVNTNYLTVKTQLEELEYFGLVTLINHNRNNKNGRPFTTVRLK